MLWLMIILGCSGGSDSHDTDSTCPDSDEDGVCDADDLCPGEDDGLDEDGDGTPDGCQLDELGRFDTLRTLVPTTSTQLELQLAYDTSGAMSTWTIFEPPLVVGRLEPDRVSTDTLTGWEGVEERLTDHTDEQLMVRIIGVQDGVKASQVYEEADLSGLSALTGVHAIREVGAEALRWEEAGDEIALELQWSFFGVP